LTRRRVSPPRRRAGSHVVLDSGGLRVRIDPLLGGRILSVTDDRGRELVEPGRPPARTIDPTSDYVAGGLGGIDDCLPGISAERVGGAGGRVVPDHGEVWCRPARVGARTTTRVTLVQVGMREDYALRRTFAVAKRTLRVDYRLESLEDVPLQVVWAAHPLLPLTEDAELDLGPIRRLRVHSGTLAAAGAELDPGRPVLDGRAVITRPGSLPTGHCVKAFAPLPAGIEVGVAYPARGVGLALRLDTDRRAWLGLWLNAMGFPADAPVGHLALEPSFGDTDALGDAIDTGTCLQVPARGEARWSLAYEVRDIA
jgi:hypothetical protein